MGGATAANQYEGGELKGGRGWTTADTHKKGSRKNPFVMLHNLVPTKKQVIKALEDKKGIIQNDMVSIYTIIIKKTLP